jgi:2-desacetyl-2-hydroxyethyl bacteriochlorophyllide A dehydrogenase
VRAAVFPAPGEFEIVEREPPRAPEGTVIVRVEACGLCGTDVHIYRGEFPTAAFPLVAGHEFAGVVEATGSAVPYVRAGDHVAVDPNIACGACRSCRRGLGHLCPNLVAVGVNVDGGFATYCQVPARQTYKVPREMSFEIAAMAEPVSCCVHGIERANVRPGDIVGVIGAGMIGLIMLQLAALRGASMVIVSEPAAHKREMAQRLGATHVLDPASADVATSVAEITGGAYADCVIDCAGTSDTARQAIALAGNGGIVLLFGVAPPSARATVSPYDIYRRELTITGSFTNPFTFRAAVALLSSGRVKVDELISHRVALSDVPDAIEMVEARQTMKVIVQPQYG